MSVSSFYFISPIGNLHLLLSDQGLLSCSFVDEVSNDLILHPTEVQEIKGILQVYFDTGDLAYFPMDPAIGTPFQQRVWEALREIPTGSTVTYAEIAKRLEIPKAAQAVGNANGQNPILLFNPCHRVIGSTGKLVGYSGGLWRKEWLLAKEGATLF
ncbi:methylated-DNA--[protein]-cysteine S-methyltransferase [Aquirufa sp. HETE-83D]|uniref:Methylated-DNA--[protein]-cysteine S-methyltransferase n=1 Tax=Aquirufa esocilacus TaxID=3096513 RepID=A0ABW6DH24_9BACT